METESSTASPVPLLARLASQVAEAILGRDAASQARAEPLERWLDRHFRSVLTKPMAPRHMRMWHWIDSLVPGMKPPALIEMWPRGSGKSTTLELGVVRLAITLRRRFVLYVCATQEQADYHVRNIADWCEACGIARAVSMYGTAKGWRRSQLRTANDFNVAGLGLDCAMRGIKIGGYRPDLIVLDDVDDIADSERVVARKLDSIQGKILAAGAPDCAVAFIQNLVHEDSVAAQLVDGRTEWLLDRHPIRIECAVENLQTELEELADGVKRWRIASGTATWEGQDLATCEKQINEWSLPTFLREAQHEIVDAGGFLFDIGRIEIAPAPDERAGWRYSLGCDFAATEGGGDYTAFVAMGMAPSGLAYVMDVVHGQWNEARVRTALVAFVNTLRREYPDLTIRIPQDPGQAGVAHARQIKTALVASGVPSAQVQIRAVTGAKHLRALPLAAAIGMGNVRLVPGDWNRKFLAELRLFTETGDHKHDDLVDAAADAFAALSEPRRELRTWVPSSAVS